MPEKDPGRLPTSEMELAVTTTNGPRIYAKNPVLARRLLHLSHYCYYRNSPALALILSSLLYLFASKSGKICTHILRQAADPGKEAKPSNNSQISLLPHRK